MERSRVLFQCPNCNEDLGISEKETEHNVHMGSFGVTISPGWSCPECGLEGRIKNSKIIVTGRKRIPPSSALNASPNPQDRPAIIIESTDESAPKTREPTPEHERTEPNPDPEDCPNRRKHGYYGRVKQQCPICGGRWHERETLTEEEIQELAEEGEEDISDDDQDEDDA